MSASSLASFTSRAEKSWLMPDTVPRGGRRRKSEAAAQDERRPVLVDGDRRHAHRGGRRGRPGEIKDARDSAGHDGTTQEKIGRKVERLARTLKVVRFVDVRAVV